MDEVDRAAREAVEREDSHVRMLTDRTREVARKLEELAAQIRHDGLREIKFVADENALTYGAAAATVQRLVARGVGNLNLEGLTRVATGADKLRTIRLHTSR